MAAAVPNAGARESSRFDYDLAVSNPVGDEVLRRIPLFRRLGAEERSCIGECARVRHYARGVEIFAEGDPGDAFLIILEGRVKVFKGTASGRQIILEIFGAGDPLGAVAVYEGSPYPASAVALEDTRLLRIEAQDLFGLLERHPALVRGLLSGLTLRIAELTRRMTELAGGRVETRFARLFLKLAERIGRKGPRGVFVPLPLQRQELADLTGTTIETCIRLMSRWEKDHVIHTASDGFLIVDRGELEVAAGR